MNKIIQRFLLILIIGLVLTLLSELRGDSKGMANFWDNDEVVTKAETAKVTETTPAKGNFWDFDEIVELVDTATTKADPAPVSEDPDRQFFQSGVGMEDRTFEPEAEGFVEPVLPEAIVTPQSDDQFVERNLSPDEQNFISMAESPRYSSELVTQTIGQGYADFTDTREATRSAQAGLTQLGYVPRGIDGGAGAGTQAALRAFQEAEGLPVTGTLDATTYERIQDPKTKKFQPTEDVPALKTALGVGNLEGLEAHFGPNEFPMLTLPFGIVTDSIKYNGLSVPRDETSRRRFWISQGVAGNDDLDPSLVSIEDATKEGVRSKDYSTTDSWVTAVIQAFKDKATDNLPANVQVSDLDTTALKTLTDLAWNAGPASIGYDSMTDVIEELQLPIDQRNPVNIRGILNTSPTQNGRILGGLMKRRAVEYNWSVLAEDRVVSWDTSFGVGTYTFADGSTYEITRAAGGNTSSGTVPSL
jgi:peptidoglycan hydrolase-like protein with peptidoglycan-binding domain